MSYFLCYVDISLCVPIHGHITSFQRDNFGQCLTTF